MQIAPALPLHYVSVNFPIFITVKGLSLRLRILKTAKRITPMVLGQKRPVDESRCHLTRFLLIRNLDVLCGDFPESPSMNVFEGMTLGGV
jgi:hypothetical protein